MRQRAFRLSALPYPKSGGFLSRLLGLLVAIGYLGVLSCGLAQNAVVRYEGQLGNLEFAGPDCVSDLPISLEVSLLVAGQQVYLLGTNLLSARLENQTLNTSWFGLPQYDTQLRGKLGDERLELELVLKTQMGVCILSKARAVLQKTTASNPQEWLELAQNEYAANLALQRGNYAQGADGLTKTFPLSLKLRGDVLSVWQQRFWQGLTLQQLNQHGEAFVVFQEVVSNLTRLVGADNFNTLQAQQGTLTSLLALGRYQEAEPAARELIARAEQTTGRSSLLTLNALRTLANALNSLQRNNEALRVYEQIYERARQAYGEGDPRIFNPWRAWANGLYLAGQREAALSELKQIYAQAQQRLGSDHYETLMTLEQLANLSLVLGQNNQALEYLQQAEASANRQLGTDNQRAQRLLTTRASILWQMDRRAEAKPLFGQIIAQLERLRTQPLPPEERRRLLQQNLVIYQNYMLVLAQEGDLPELFRVSELTKGRTLLESLTAQQAVQSAVLPAEAVQRLEAFQFSFTRLEQTLQTAEEPQRSQLLSERLRLSLESQRYQQTLQAQYPRYAELSQPKLLNLEQAAGATSSDAALLSFVELDQVLLAFVVTSLQVSMVAIELTPNLEQTISAYRKLLETPDGGLGLERQGLRVYGLSDGSYRLLSSREAPPTGARRINNWQAMSQTLGQLLIEPVVTKLGAGVRRLVISPDGPLAFLPFETLRVGNGLLLERFAVSYTPSLSVYAQLNSTPNPNRSADLLALGNPTYNQTLTASNPNRSPILDTLRKRNFPLVALPGAEREAKAAAALFDGRAQVWLGAEASLARLQALSSSGVLAQYRYLLLAAHGFVDSEAPDQVALLLSQSSSDDGVLDIGRVLGLRLQSDLVILSACNTGIGLMVRGEGVVGLSYAFYLAGSSHTLLTQWAINDASSSEFSPKLLARLKAGMAIEEALRQTKLEFLRRPALAHPAYWAAFVLY